jgi:two-component system, chemotaxis family, protein-glutamate methylesterase/glutaminase
VVGIGNNEPVKVMLVDDSAIIRGLYRRMIDQDPDIEIVSDAGNGQQAIDRLKKTPVHLIVLDIEMPVMDGLTAIPHLLEVQPDVMILMSSTLTTRNAEFGIQAMNVGAADYIEKPSSSNELTTGVDFKTEFLRKIKALGATAQRRPSHTAGSVAKRSTRSPDVTPSEEKAGSGWNLEVSKDIKLREPGTSKPRIVAVGSSTGGPQALANVFENLPATIEVPIVVAQHMPPTFTKILAERIENLSSWKCHEAEDGEELKSGTVLIAPGGYHMVVAMDGAKVVARLNQDAAENFCRPAVDPLFRSVASVYGAASLAVVLTGMGHDGRNGGQMIVDKGGTLYAQDEQSSVVWGMPGAVAVAGICSKVIPLDSVATEIKNYVSRVV